MEIHIQFYINILLSVNCQSLVSIQITRMLFKAFNKIMDEYLKATKLEWSLLCINLDNLGFMTEKVRKIKNKLIKKSWENQLKHFGCVFYVINMIFYVIVDNPIQFGVTKSLDKSTIGISISTTIFMVAIKYIQTKISQTSRKFFKSSRFPTQIIIK